MFGSAAFDGVWRVESPTKTCPQCGFLSRKVLTCLQNSATSFREISSMKLFCEGTGQFPHRWDASGPAVALRAKNFYREGAFLGAFALWFTGSARTATEACCTQLFCRVLLFPLTSLATSAKACQTRPKQRGCTKATEDCRTILKSPRKLQKLEAGMSCLQIICCQEELFWSCSQNIHKHPNRKKSGTDMCC